MRYRALVPVFLLLVLAGCPQGGQQTEDEASPTPAESPAESPADDNAARAASLAGTWTGEWRNTTFGSSGSASAVVTVDQAAGTFTIELDLGGNVFGESDPPPQRFQGNLSDTSFRGTVILLGNFTAEVNPDQNTFTFEAADVPSARVNQVSGEGTLEDNRLTANIEIILSDGSTANSVLELTKT